MQKRDKERDMGVKCESVCILLSNSQKCPNVLHFWLFAE